MKIKTNISGVAKVVGASVVMAALAACGGGGGGGDSTGASAPGSGASTPPATNTNPTSGNVTTAQYGTSSAQLAAFQLLNQQRQACGFSTLQENTFLDTAASKHATWEQDNNSTSDTELVGQTGYTGGTYTERAVAAGFASGYNVGGVGAGFSGPSTSEGQYGQSLIYEWESGVYHSPALMVPVTEVGIGEVDSTVAATTTVWGSMSFANLQPMTSSSAPLTFPCQGTTGVPYEGVSEIPTPPNTTGSWGTPIVVVRNPSDTIVLSSGTIVPTLGGAVTNLQLLDSANDPNHELQPYEASAYPNVALSANTEYSVSINGTLNGTPFSSNFTFTTGNIIQ